MTSNHVGGVIISIVLLVLLTGSVTAGSITFGLVEAGSSFDATTGSVTTHVGSGMVNDNPADPVTLGYDISAGGITIPDGSTTPMAGSVEAYVRAHTMNGHYRSSLNSGELTYSDVTMASGLISSFRKTITCRFGGVLS